MPTRPRDPAGAATATAADLAPRLRMAVMRLARRMRQLDTAADGITISQLSALFVVDRLGPLALGDLAEAEKVQPPTMTRIAVRLDELGLVTRTPSPEDRRVVLVGVTAAGRRLVAESRRRRTEYLAERLGGLDDDERATLEGAAAILERLVEQGP